MKRVLFILAFALASDAACTPKNTETPRRDPAIAVPTDRDAIIEQQTRNRLREFSAAFAQHPNDEGWALSELAKLRQELSDEQLPAVERFAAGPEGLPIAWGLARLLVERGRLNGAANVIVSSLDGESHDDPRTAVWKWWDFCFHERTDFDDLTHRMGESFYRQYLLGTPSRRRIVALIFSLKPEDSELPPEDFHKKAFKDAQ